MSVENSHPSAEVTIADISAPLTKVVVVHVSSVASNASAGAPAATASTFEPFNNHVILSTAVKSVSYTHLTLPTICSV